jgi:tetratricopeptide (TPR) repeat protein
MIAVSERELTAGERSQLERRDLAVGSWSQGNLDNADLLLDSIVDEGMSPAVAIRVFVAKAAVQAERSDYAGSLAFLQRAASFLDAADMRFQGAFYNQRARAHKELGNLDAALTDYAGASACFEAAGDADYQGAALLNTAGLYLLIGDLASARANIERALSVLNASGSSYLSQAYDTLANIELEAGHLGPAVAAIQRAFDLVGDNEIWRQTFINTRDKIEEKLRDLSGALHALNADMVRWALIKTGGNLTQTGKLTGLTHKGVSYIVDRHPEMEKLRAKRRTRTRLKSKITKS